MMLRENNWWRERGERGKSERKAKKGDGLVQREGR